MKSLKDFFDALTPESKKWLLSKRRFTAWFDENEPDGYRKYTPLYSDDPSDLGQYKSLKVKSTSGWRSWYDSDERIKDLEKRIFDQLYHARMKNEITDKDIIVFIDQYQTTVESKLEYKDAFLIIQDKHLRKECYRALINGKDEPLSPEQMLFGLDDYSDVKSIFGSEPMDLSDYSGSDLVSFTEIFGAECFEGYARKNPRKFGNRLRSIEYFCKYRNDEGQKQICEEFKDMFDRLFFLDNGWTDSEKKEAVIGRYSDSGTSTDQALDYFENFANDILSVDHKYYRFIYTLVGVCPALGNYIYDAKKPDDEINENTITEMKFRYNKEIRKLGKLANICIRESLSKANNSFLKEVGPLLRLYNFNFNMIYNMMFPEDEAIPV